MRIPALAAVPAAVLAGSARAAQALEFQQDLTEDSAQHLDTQKIKKLFEAGTDGKIDVQIPANTTDVPTS